MKKGHVFFICGITWAGKWTLVNWLLNENIENLEFALSCKTREPRQNEIVWVDYIKLTFEEFEEAIERWDFLEYNFVHNQDYYWTRKKDIIENWIEKGKIILKEIDMLIVPSVLEKMKSLRENFSIIFIDIPIEMIKERMILRWDNVSGKDYENRISSAKMEKKFSNLVDLIIDWTKTKQEVLLEAKNFILSKI